MSTRPAWLNPALWVLAVVGINMLWFVVVDQEAPIELNNEEQVESFRSFDLDGPLWSDDPIPARLVLSLSTELPDETNLTYVLRLDNQTVITKWDGTVAEAPERWEGELAPGTYVLETQVPEDVQLEQTLLVAPFKPVQAIGHLALTVGLLVLALAEQGVRDLIRNRVAAGTSSGQPERSPFKPLQKGMPDADRYMVDDAPWREPVR
ncbi:MAG: hypothetical protein DWC07_04570 [Candidatus Poseidoniales archaeon]|nr:MAG: hypothetical protein DWC07_04570 [Candidatus Poseidoniales archaeon]